VDEDYIMESGRVAVEGMTVDMKNRSDLLALYLGWTRFSRRFWGGLA
jgi:ABC-type branched-subunit amino acid transport system ATPase component